MMTLTARDFREHMRTKDAQTKGQLARRYYSNFRYDMALPCSWVAWARDILKLHGVTDDPASHFIWLYASIQDHFGQPAPITYRGVELLEVLEK